ncbi:hypothetical protein [Stappia indica]|uniref:Invasion protein IalB, involved in pathogenesis n=1 Tax=Stappia indica TaxID=538381 RepID=A0A857C4J4_9HYPH|nr:hypothetical protein [Stappia indica]QGZ33755.1 hypothetical protein GH266_04070 [Stappia indica]
MTSRLALPALAAALLLASLPLAGAQEMGPWYGGFEADLPVGEQSITIELDQLAGGTAGMASVVMFLSEAAPCRTTAMRREFCMDLWARTDQPLISGEVRGVRFTPTTATVAFTIPGDDAVRIAEITAEAGRYRLFMLHPDRGVDMDIAMTRRAHSCQSSMCDEGRLDALRRQPARFSGPLVDPAFLARYPALARAPSGLLPASRQQAAPPPAAPGGSTRWRVESLDDGRSMGELYLGGQSWQLSGGGQVDSAGFGPLTNVAVAPRAALGGGFSLDITFHADGSGERREGILLLGFPRQDGIVEGTLVEDRHVSLVRLRRDDGFDADAGADAEAEGDMPGIGVWGPAYRLRNVPEGRRLSLRDRPSRDGQAVGAMGGDASEILVLGCTPEIDTMTFEKADRAGKRDLLATAWCEVEWSGMRGHVPGTYLDPILEGDRS